MRWTRLVVLAALSGAFSVARAQESTLTLKGGYVLTHIEDADTNADGWRIDGSWEVGTKGGKLTHGLAAGYLSSSASREGPAQTAKYSVWTVPITYVPKYTFGGGPLKVFLRGALGLQFSGITREGTAVIASGNDWGFYGGVGAGVAYHFGERFQLGLDYEWAYCSNSYYRDGFLNSFSLGLGVRL